MSKRRTSVLFICLGNICRSPAAQGVFETLVSREKQEDSFHIDSCGTSSYHTGDLPDGRMLAHAGQRGYKLTHEARQFDADQDFTNFDYIVTMDDSNYRNIKALDPKGEFASKIHKMVSFCAIHDVKEVPDPYYQDDHGFELVLDILEDACQGLLDHIQRGQQ